jgi:hypothetical protein
MKFRITASEIRWAIGLGKAHAKLLVEGYPQLKGKVKIDTTGTPETTIEFNDLDELLSLDCDEIIIYKQAQFSENDKKDDECEYTIEICNL